MRTHAVSAWCYLIHTTTQSCWMVLITSRVLFFRRPSSYSPWADVALVLCFGASPIFFQEKGDCYSFVLWPDFSSHSVALNHWPSSHLCFVPNLRPPLPSHINHYIVGYRGKWQATSTLPALIQIALMAISCGGNAPQRKQWWQKRLTYLPRCDSCEWERSTARRVAGIWLKLQPCLWKHE